MQTLKKDEMTRLVAYINDEFGSDLDFDEFADKMLGAFEDVPGFETLSRSKANRYVRELWRSYMAKPAKKAASKNASRTKSVGKEDSTKQLPAEPAPAPVEDQSFAVVAAPRLTALISESPHRHDLSIALGHSRISFLSFALS